MWASGTGATVGKILGMRHAMKAGVGSYTVALPGGVLVSSLVVVNAFGDVRDPATGKIVAGARKDPTSREFVNTTEEMKRKPPAGWGRMNTTLGVVATNAKLSKVEAQKLAHFASLALARASIPSTRHSTATRCSPYRWASCRPTSTCWESPRRRRWPRRSCASVRLAKTLGGVVGLG